MKVAQIDIPPKEQSFQEKIQIVISNTDRSGKTIKEVQTQTNSKSETNHGQRRTIRSITDLETDPVGSHDNTIKHAAFRSNLYKNAISVDQ